MEKQKKSIKLIIVAIMIFIMTSYDLFIIGKATISYANDLMKGKVQISSYFKDLEGKNINSIEATTEEEVYAFFNISVAEGGYFSDGQINLENNNFIFDKTSVEENIASVEENIIKLKQINGGENKEIKVKILVAKSDIYNLNMLNHETNINLIGKYTSNKEENVETKTSLQVKYINPYLTDTKGIISTKLITNKVYKVKEENKRIVQIEIENNLKKNNYPIKQTSFELQVPENVQDVNVYSRGTQMTDGKAETEFSDDRWNYNQEMHLLNINLQNAINVNEYGDNLVNWKQNVTDKIIVTYTLEDTVELPESILVKTSIDLYDDILGDRQSSKLNEEVTIMLNEEKDGIIEGKTKTSEQSIYKGKIYCGEDRDLEVLTNVDVKYAGIENEINVQKESDIYQVLELNEETNKKEVIKELEAKINYKGLRISKQNVLNILGDIGSIEIYNTEKIIVTINKALIEKLENLKNAQQEINNEQQEDINLNNDKKVEIAEENYTVNLINDYIVITYKEEQEDLIFNIKDVENQGTLKIYHTEIIKNNDIEREELKKVNRLNEKWKVIRGNQTEEKKFNSNIELLDTVTLSQFRIKNNTLIAGKITQGVEFQVLLRNNNEKYDLFKNPTLKIKLPKEISDVKINDVKLVYADGLEEESRKIVKNDDGTKTIKIKLKNEQKEHQINVEGIVGTVVSIDCDMQLDKNTTVDSSIITVNVKNDEDVVYEKNNMQKDVLNYIVPKEEKEQEINKDIEKNNNEVQDNSLVKNSIEKNDNQNNVIVENKKVDENNLEENKKENKTEIKEQNNVKNNILKNVGDSGSAQEEEKLTVTKAVSTGANENAENTDVHEREILKYTITVKNNTNEDIKNVIVTDNIPDEVTLVQYDSSWGNGNGYYDINQKYFNKNIESIKKNQTEIVEYFVRVNKNAQNIGMYIGGSTIETQAIVKIDGENIEYKSNKVTNKIIEGKIEVNLNWSDSYEKFLCEDTEYDGFILKIKNLTNDEIKNIEVKKYISEKLEFLEAFELVSNEFELDSPGIDEIQNVIRPEKINVFVKAEDGSGKLQDSCYNKENRIFTWNIDKLEKDEEKAILISVKTEKLPQGEYEKGIINRAEVKFNQDGQENIYTSNNMFIRICKDNVTLELDCSAKDTYIEEKTNFEYYIKIKNIGVQEIQEELIEELPDGVIGESIEYKINGKVATDELELLGGKSLNGSILLNPGDFIEITVKVKANNISIEGLKELPIENKITYGDFESNIIKNIIIAKKSENIIGESNINEENKNNGQNINNSNNTNIQNGINVNSNLNLNNNIISGCVWFDANKDGMRDNNEKYMAGIEVQLIKKSTGNFIGKTVTDSNGKYKFERINNGEYIIGFVYDTKIYTLTKYQKNKVSSDRNSDVLSMQDLSGNSMKIGLTDIIKINNSSSKNIDMGLIKDTKFNLQIRKYIDSIIVNNKEGTKTYSYNNNNFAKIEIAGKQLKDSSVKIKYKFLIKNNGELPGYVTEIIDYLPSGLEFNQKENQDWNYEGENLINTELKDEIINVGETKEITLVLIKKMSNMNTGNVVNTAKITKIKNELGYNDYNKGDNKGTANVLITIKTGEKIVLGISVVSLALMIIGIGIYFIKKKVL